MKTSGAARIKRGAKRWLPEPLRLAASRLVFGANRFVGPYADWEAAERDSGGYDASAILERTLQAALAVQRGEGAYERDSILFPQAETPFALISALLLAAALEKTPLRVLDFGGSLGSQYFRCKPYLDRIEPVRWCIIEQGHIARSGREHFERDGLFFRGSVEEAATALGSAPTIVVASSVLQYLSFPHDVLAGLLNLKPRVFFLDRTVFAVDDIERIFVQRVPRRLYPASYPLRFLSWPSFLAAVGGEYWLVDEFMSYEGTIAAGAHSANYRGAVWVRR